MKEVNVLFVGQCGVGKTRTINSLFNTKGNLERLEDSKDFEKYELGNLTIWDTPGLGDGAEKDKKYTEQIRDLLQMVDESGDLLIDLVVVVLDASHRDLGATCHIINKVVIPYLGTQPEKRLLIALNQADRVLNDPKKAWDWASNKPTLEASEYLAKKAAEINERIFKDTGVKVYPIYYTAGYTDADGVLDEPWNISKLLYYIVEGIRPEKRQMLEEHLKSEAKAADIGGSIGNMLKGLLGATSPAAKSTKKEKKMGTEDFLKKINEQKGAEKLGELDKQKLAEFLEKSKGAKANIMITGATGAGKSSTINALLNMQEKDVKERAKVDMGAKPETMEIAKYELDNFTIWDTPGLGDGVETDGERALKIRDLLQEMDENGNPLIDLVLVVLDGGSRDIGTSYMLINDVIIPYLGKDPENRLIVAINQADCALNDPKKAWDWASNKPTPEALGFLYEKVENVQTRIKEATGVKIHPIFYKAGYTDKNGVQDDPYNIAKLLNLILENLSESKRVMLTEHLNKNEKMYLYADGTKEALADLAALEAKLEKETLEKERLLAYERESQMEVERDHQARYKGESAAKNAELLELLELEREENESLRLEIKRLKISLRHARGFKYF